jgi:type IV pilus assembly protein PilN
MRIPINLSSQPLENLRPLRVGVALAALAAVLFGGIIVRNELRNRSEFQALIERRTALQASLGSLQRERQELQEWLDQPHAVQVRERSAFLNSLIQRKSLSWTQMFVDLEKTLPQRARITSIKPSLSNSPGADLALTAEADAMSPLVEFLKNLEGSPKFGPPAVGSQSYSTRSNAEGGITIDLTTRYLQQSAAAPVDTAALAPGSAEKPPAAAAAGQAEEQADADAAEEVDEVDQEATR